MGNLITTTQTQLRPYERDFPLHDACYNGHTDKVKKLLKKKGTDINQPDDNSISPVFRAAQMLRVDILEMLFQKGAAPPDINDSLGFMIWLTSWQYSNVYLQISSEPDGVRHFDTRFIKILDILMKNGADPEGAYSYLEKKKCSPVVFKYLTYLKRRHLLIYRYE